MWPWLDRRRHAVLFVIPGGSGGFPPINRELYRRDPAFRDSIDATSLIVDAMLGWNPAAAFRGEASEPMSPALERRNEVVHHGMTRIALIDQWAAAGVVADGAVGVSLGEVIAPYAAGACSREACLRLAVVVAQAITEPPTPQFVFVVTASGEEAKRVCRTAGMPVEFLGASTRELSLLLCRAADADGLRRYLGNRVIKEAPSGWPYHTPRMHWWRDWADEHLGPGVTLTRGARPVYSSAVGGHLPETTRLDGQCLQWMMSFPSHFASAVATAFNDGFDTAVQMSAMPMQVFADVSRIAEFEGRRVQQYHAFEAAACAAVRKLRRRPVTPQVSVRPEGGAFAHSGWDDEAAEREVERIAERVLQPLVAGQPFDVVAGLADPIADAVTAEREGLRREIASLVLQWLCGDAGAAPAAGARGAAAAALRALKRLAPDAILFQPLVTVKLGQGDMLQLVIARSPAGKVRSHA